MWPGYGGPRRVRARWMRLAAFVGGQQLCGVRLGPEAVVFVRSPTTVPGLLRSFLPDFHAAVVGMLGGVVFAAAASVPSFPRRQPWEPHASVCCSACGSAGTSARPGLGSRVQGTAGSLWRSRSPRELLPGTGQGWRGLQGLVGFERHTGHITHLQQCSTAVSWGAKGPAAALCSALEGRLQQRQTFVNVNIAAASGGVAVTHPVASASAASLLAVHPPSRPVLLPATIPQGRVFGNRIPRRYIVVTGYGETDQGSGSDPFETGEGASTKGRQLQRGRAPGWAV